MTICVKCYYERKSFFILLARCYCTYIDLLWRASTFIQLNSAAAFDDDIFVVVLVIAVDICMHIGMLYKLLLLSISITIKISW